MTRTLLIAGATGLVGQAATEHFAAQPGWSVVTLSRRPPPARPGVRHLPADLCDAAACRSAIAAAPEITHVLYAALYEKPSLLAGWTDHGQIDTNLTMLRNLLDALEDHAPGLRHLSLLQGTKAYGSHVRRVPVPAKERWARGGWPIFYWPQEDLLRERQRGRDWAFTILRPQIILGHAVGSPMNIVAAIGVYAALQREAGQPMAFPGGGRYVNACSDSRLIARAVAWAGTAAAAANETFNVVNGDVLLWQDMWPALAQALDVDAGEPRPLQLAEAMPPLEERWQAVGRRHGLRPTTLAQLVGSSWQFADRNFAYGQAAPDHRVVSPVKLRQAGFHDCHDTEEALLYWLGRMRQGRYIP